MMDEKPVPPTRNASVRDKNGSTSGDRDKEKKKWFGGGKKTAGEKHMERERECVCVCVCVYVTESGGRVCYEFVSYII